MEFPFAKVRTVDDVWAQIPNYQEVVKACPEEFMSNPGQWVQAMLRLQCEGGWTDERKQKAVELLITNDVTEAQDQIRYLWLWVRSFKPTHEEKAGVCAWIMSLMFRECPKW